MLRRMGARYTCRLEEEEEEERIYDENYVCSVEKCHRGLDWEIGEVARLYTRFWILI